MKNVSALAISLALIVGLAGCATPATTATQAETDPTHAPVASAPAEVEATQEPVAITPSTPQAYYDELLSGGVEADISDRATVQSGHDRAIATFPFPLAPGDSFPTNIDTLQDPTGAWHYSLAMYRIWTHWEASNARAALEAHEAGDDVLAGQYLDILQAGYESVIYPENIAGGDGFAHPARIVDAARAGDYAPLTMEAINPLP